jgi:CHAT domain-containing protein
VVAAGRDTVPAEASPVFVEDTVGGSIWAHWEAKYIRDAYYRDGRCLGARPPDEATVDRVLASLPGEESSGASLLHLSCHARTGGSPAASHLRLSGDQPLAVDRVLRRAQFRRPDLPGGLVVLSACVSDLSMSNYDEALTLATAFAAAGAASVVGTRWLVPDARTALMMFMFHHYLTAGRSPGEALRLAQLWMLDPDRAIPPKMPRMLADEVPRKDLGDPVAWAGFIHMGR